MSDWTDSQEGLGSFLLRRPLAWAVAGAVVLQLAETWTGWGGFPCPLKSGLDVPCPGCGLSRACVLLVQGHVGEALRLHAFAPLALASAVALTAASVMPRPHRVVAAEALHRLDARRAIPLAVLALVVGYWMLRLATGWRG